MNIIDTLMGFFSLQLNYGLMLDHYTANLLMGHFLGKNMIKGIVHIF